jgi:hypothetical protein
MWGVADASLLALTLFFTHQMWSKSKFESSFRVSIRKKKKEKNLHISIFGFPTVTRNIERWLNLSLQISFITRFS